MRAADEFKLAIPPIVAIIGKNAQAQSHPDTRHDFPTSTRCCKILVDIDMDQCIQVGSGHHEDESSIFVTWSGQWAVRPSFEKERDGVETPSREGWGIERRPRM